MSDQAELSLVFTDDAYIAELNTEYLNRQGPTNVIAFPMQEGEATGVNPGLLGDVVVSVDTALREATENGLDPDEHLMRLVIHGLLHLLGYDHVDDEKRAKEMFALTEKLLAAGE